MNWLPIFPPGELDPMAFDMALKLIRQGAFPASAFLAAGLNPALLAKMEVSRAAEEQGQYRLVLQAVGVARAQAEINAHKEITRSWLLNGAGSLIKDLPRWGAKPDSSASQNEMWAALGDLYKELRDRPVEREIILRTLEKLEPGCTFGVYADPPAEKAP